MVKNLPANAGDMGSVPGSGRSPREGKGIPLQYSCLGNPWTEEPGGLQSMRSHRVRHDRVSAHAHHAACLVQKDLPLRFLPDAHSSPQGGLTALPGAHPCPARRGRLWTRAGGRRRSKLGGGTDPPAPPGRADSGAEPAGQASQRRARSVPPELGGSSGHEAVSTPPGLRALSPIQSPISGSPHPHPGSPAPL